MKFGCMVANKHIISQKLDYKPCYDSDCEHILQKLDFIFYNSKKTR